MTAADALEFGSGPEPVTVVELFTSQGCSSCPPAEAWLNRFVDHPDLWTGVVPLALHVDYWDRLGWRDPYASAAFSARQHRYRAVGGVATVYTPGFVVDGREWRGWFSGGPLPAPAASGGVLAATLAGDRLEVRFGPGGATVLNVAVLGFGIRTAVQHGENGGRTLPQEFVVLEHFEQAGEDGQWTVTLPPVRADGVERYGIAVWVTRPGELTPLQAAGAWMPAVPARGSS